MYCVTSFHLGNGGKHKPKITIIGGGRESRERMSEGNEEGGRIGDFKEILKEANFIIQPCHTLNQFVPWLVSLFRRLSQ